MLWLAGGDPVKVPFYERIPMIEYWFLLNKKKKEVERMQEEAKKQALKNKTK